MCLATGDQCPTSDGALFNGWCYNLERDPASWADARTGCQAQGVDGDLAIVNNPYGAAINVLLEQLVYHSFDPWPVPVSFTGWIGARVIDTGTEFRKLSRNISLYYHMIDMI